jgi:hypothetical protein
MVRVRCCIGGDERSSDSHLGETASPPGRTDNTDPYW